jgi:hypothetical protein
MSDANKVISKVLVLDSDADCYDKIKLFCDANNLIGLKVHEDNIVQVLKSNVDLGGILLSETFSGVVHGGISLARAIHNIRPELPIFLRREERHRSDPMTEKNQSLFCATYTIDEIAALREAVDANIFSFIYPNVLVRGISELTKDTLANQFKGMSVEVAIPYIVRDQIIFGEIFTLMPIESNWCRGYMMLQAEEEPLTHLVKADRTHVRPDKAYDFRNMNNMLGEITNLIWGAFKSRYIADIDHHTHLSQVPLIVNHLHRYISFGSENPQLCFKYILTDESSDRHLSLMLLQRFIFNLNWSPTDFRENPASVESLVASGELEMF